MKPKKPYYQIGQIVTFYSPTIKQVRKYIITKIYTNFRNSRKIAYKLHVLNQNNEFWGLVLENNLIKMVKETVIKQETIIYNNGNI